MIIIVGLVLAVLIVVCTIMSGKFAEENTQIILNRLDLLEQLRQSDLDTITSLTNQLSAIPAARTVSRTPEELRLRAQEILNKLVDI